MIAIAPLNVFLVDWFAITFFRFYGLCYVQLRGAYVSSGTKRLIVLWFRWFIRIQAVLCLKNAVCIVWSSKFCVKLVARILVDNRKWNLFDLPLFFYDSFIYWDRKMRLCRFNTVIKLNYLTKFAIFHHFRFSRK